MNTTLFELFVEARNLAPERGAFEGELQIAKPEFQQLFVGKTGPRQRLAAPVIRSARPNGSDAVLRGGCRRHGFVIGTNRATRSLPKVRGSVCRSREAKSDGDGWPRRARGR